jgi:propanediol dehydratase small subunit
MIEKKAKEIYPLGSKNSDMVKTPTGKKLSEITIENILAGTLQPEDCRISSDSLEHQARVAESEGYRQLAENFRRAAELTKIPDKEILRIYNLLRPYRSTRKDLLLMADHLEATYQAKINAAFIREAAEGYKRNGRLKNEI